MFLAEEGQASPAPPFEKEKRKWLIIEKTY